MLQLCKGTGVQHMGGACVVLHPMTCQRSTGGCTRAPRATPHPTMIPLTSHPMIIPLSSHASHHHPTMVPLSCIPLSCDVWTTSHHHPMAASHFRVMCGPRPTIIPWRRPTIVPMALASHFRYGWLESHDHPTKVPRTCRRVHPVPLSSHYDATNVPRTWNGVFIIPSMTLKVNRYKK